LSEIDPEVKPWFGFANGVPVQSWSLLEIAAGAGSARVVRALLAKGGDLAELGDAPRYAAEEGRVECIDELLAHGADPVEMLARAVAGKALASAEHLVGRVAFASDPARAADVVCSLDADVPASLFERLVGAGLDLNADAAYESLGTRIGESGEAGAAWLTQLIARGFQLDAQRVAYMLQGLHDKLRGLAVALLDIALTQQFDLDAAVSVRSEEEEDPPTTLMDLALEQFPLAVVERLAVAGAKPTDRKIQKGWPEAKAKIAWLAKHRDVPAASVVAGPSRELLDAIGDAPERKKTLALNRSSWDESGQFSHAQYDLAGIEACKQLKKLTANVLGLVEIAELATLTKLEMLELMNNEIVDLSPLASLVKLTDLRLAYNPFTDVAPLRGLTALEVLYLSESPVADISPLVTCKALEYLSLGGTQVADLSPIAKLPALTNLVLRECKQLVIEPGNATYKIITQLIERGVDVFVQHPVIDDYRAGASTAKKPAKRAPAKKRTSKKN
jgi:hypothetical protein